MLMSAAERRRLIALSKIQEARAPPLWVPGRALDADVYLPVLRIACVHLSLHLPQEEESALCCARPGLITWQRRLYDLRCRDALGREGMP